MALYVVERNIKGPVTLRRTILEIPSPPVFSYRNRNDATRRLAPSHRVATFETRSSILAIVDKTCVFS